MVFGAFVGLISPKNYFLCSNTCFENQTRSGVEAKRSEKNIGMLIWNFDVFKTKGALEIEEKLKMGV